MTILSFLLNINNKNSDANKDNKELFPHQTPIAKNPDSLYEPGL
jgi:hypothetical protein